MMPSAEEHLERLQAARSARVEGFVKLLDLEYFLACDESYSVDTLDKIGTIFQVGGFAHDGSWSKEHRHGFWLLVLLRWTGIRSNALKAKLRHIGRYLPAYKYDTASGHYHRISAAGTDAGLFDKIYLSLDEVSAYMAKIQYAYRIEISLPESLKVVEPAIPKIESGNRFQVPDGTGWDGVKITITADDEARIKTPNVNRPAKYSDLGMADNRTLKKDTSWELLLIFADQGTIKPGTKAGINSKKISKAVQRLNAKLKRAFGIDESAFTNYRKTQRYSPKFQLVDGRDAKAKKQNDEENQPSDFDKYVEDKKRCIRPDRHFNDIE